MPFPTDEKLMALAGDIVKAINDLFGVYPAFRAVHAKGVLLSGTFTPTKEAALLSRAPHFNRASTPVVVRLSDNTGIPTIPDNDPNTNPRGMAIRFMLAEHVHTDIIAHSANAFPAKDGYEFLEFLRAIAASASAKSSPTPVEAFLGAHPAALAFVQPLPIPSSFARLAYFALVAYRFRDAEGASRFGRYRIVPSAGVDALDAAAAKTKGPNFLFEELAERLAAGSIGFDIQAQLANAGDVVDNVTIHWPEDREVVTLGKLALTSEVPENPSEQKKIIFDPLPRVDGIEASDDPLLELRAGAYLLSGKRRRAATE